MSATEKLAISLPKDLIEKLRRARQEGRIESVSGHIADLLRREDDWLDARATLDRIYESCPEPEAEHYAWARRALGAGPGSGPGGPAGIPAGADPGERPPETPGSAGPGERPPETPGSAGPGGRPPGTPAKPAA
jgi:Arc/MetJ-type ribon-helix-helix transcriptional regulator